MQSVVALLEHDALGTVDHVRRDLARERDTERARILGDLHDGLGPMLVGMNMRVRAELRHRPAPVLEALASDLAECRSDDPESASVVEAYLDRVHGPAWRERESGGADAGGERGPRKAAMSRDEAYAVLGLKPGAAEAEIREAYHRLMKKLHPDQGGSDYLAARLNEARDLLLGS